MECTICLEPITAAVTTGHVRCGHWFHFECLLLWSQRSSSCPMCRQQFDEVLERPLIAAATDIPTSAQDVESAPASVFGAVIQRIPCVQRTLPSPVPVPPEEAMRLYEFVFQQEDAEMEDTEECAICGQSPCACGSTNVPESPRRRSARSPGRSRASLGRLGRRQTTQNVQLVYDLRRRRTTSATGARGLTLASDNYFLNDDDEVDPLTLPPATPTVIDDTTMGRIHDGIEETRNLARLSRAAVEERAWRFLDEYRREERQPTGRRRSSLINVFSAEGDDSELDNIPRTSSVPHASHTSTSTSVSSASGSSIFSSVSSRSSASSSRLSLGSQNSSRQSSIRPSLSTPASFRRPTPLPFRNPLSASSADMEAPRICGTAESEVPSPRSGSPRSSPPLTGDNPEDSGAQPRNSGSTSPVSNSPSDAATSAMSHIRMSSPSEEASTRVEQNSGPSSDTSGQGSSESANSGQTLPYDKKKEVRRIVKTRLHRYYPDSISKEQFTEINMAVCERVYSYLRGPEAQGPFNPVQLEKWTKVVHHLVSADLVAKDLLVG